MQLQYFQLYTTQPNPQDFGPLLFIFSGLFGYYIGIVPKFSVNRLFLVSVRLSTWTCYLTEPALQRMSRSTCCCFENLGLETPYPRLASVCYANSNYTNDLILYHPATLWAYGTQLTLAISFSVLSSSHSSSPLSLLSKSSLPLFFQGTYESSMFISFFFTIKFVVTIFSASILPKFL